MPETGMRARERRVVCQHESGIGTRAVRRYGAYFGVNELRPTRELFQKTNLRNGIPGSIPMRPRGVLHVVPYVHHPRLVALSAIDGKGESSGNTFVFWLTESDAIHLSTFSFRKGNLSRKLLPSSPSECPVPTHDLEARKTACGRKETIPHGADVSKI